MTIFPKISIITVVRNGEKYIGETIKSVLAQSYKNIEYIIIDGNSTDGTLSIIRKYQQGISYWVSEPDKGIYDAMNKGVEASTGQWLLFVNADDYLATPNVIEQAVQYLESTNKLIVYGQVLFLYESGKTKLYGQSWAKSSFRFRKVAMCIPHQATFHHQSLFTTQRFDTTFKIAGDYDFLLRHLKNNDAEFFPLIVSKMRADGVSFSSSKIALLSETRKVQLKNEMYRFSPPPAWFKSALKLLLVDGIIKIFGASGKDRVAKLLRFNKNKQVNSRTM